MKLKISKSYFVEIKNVVKFLNAKLIHFLLISKNKLGSMELPQSTSNTIEELKPMFSKTTVPTVNLGLLKSVSAKILLFLYKQNS